MKAKRPLQPTNTLAYAPSVGPKPSDENCAACNPTAASASTSATDAALRHIAGATEAAPRATAAHASTQIRIAMPNARDGLGWWCGQPRQIPFVFKARR